MFQNIKYFGATNKTINSQICIKVSNKTAKSIGLGGSISVILCAMIGIGIFFKNKTVFINNNNNPYGIILSWVLAFIIAIATAYTYGEISRCQTKVEGSGISGWAERYVGYNHGRFLKLFYSLFCYPIKAVAISIYTAEVLLNINPAWSSPNKIECNFGFVLLISFCLLLSFVLINFLSSKAGNKLSKVFIYTKFLPILMIIVCGIVVSCLSNEGNLFHKVNESPFTMTGVLNSLPGILFAFDAFLVVGNIAQDVKSPTKNIPLSIVISMVIAGIIYISITISQIFAGVGEPFALFNKMFGNSKVGNTTINILFSVALCSCMIGAMNIHVYSGIGSLQAAIDEEIIIGSKSLKRLTNGKQKNFAAVCVISCIYLFLYAILGIPSFFMQTDQIYDGLTNTLVVFVFLNYGLIAFMSIINRKINRIPASEVSHQKGQCIAASISTIGCLFVACYGMFYQFMYDPIVDGNNKFISWGLFFNNETVLTKGMNKWIASILFWCIAVLIFLIPLFHDLLIKCFNPTYNQSLIFEVNINKKVKIISI